MTRVLFYHDAQNRLLAACEWLCYAYRKAQRVLVYAPEQEVAERIDRALWSMDPLSFIPHVLAHSELAGQTPIIIATSLDTLPHDENLLNLSNDLPPGFSRFHQLVEIVAAADSDPLDAEHARRRYRAYKDMGYPLKAFDLRRSS